MKRIEVKRRSVNLEELRLREANPKDCSTFIEEPVICVEGGEPKIVYSYLPEPLPELVNALKSIEYSKDFRTGGLPTNSRIFGYSPRSTIRKDFCGTTSLATAYPAQHAVICASARVAEKLYEEHRPDLYETHRQTTDEHVKAEWRISEVFTSGIANKDNQLRYHFDTGNFKNVWSAMLVFKRDIEGGFLCVPEYDICFQLRDHSAFLFDGQGLLHGVTPFTKLTPLGYRYSIVYYSLRQMWNCLSPSDELIRIRKLKTEREHKRAGL